MKNSSCKFLLERYPKISEVEDLRSTLIANCVFNIFFSYIAIMLNIATIHAMRRTVLLPKTLQTLLLSLAVSDVGVGFFVQLFYFSLLVKWLQQNDAGCNTYMVYLITSSSFASASFLSVVAISVDRFLAIHLHLRYQELVTHKRVIAVVILIWVLSISVPLMLFWLPLDIFNIVMVVLGVVGLIFTTMVYIRIYFTVRRHKNQIHVLQQVQVQHNGEMSSFASLVKSAIGIFYVYLVFLACYLPYFVCLASFKINGSSIALKRAFLFALTVVYLNSSLNPVIYSWKMRHIRQAIMDMLRNMSRLRNRLSH